MPLTLEGGGLQAPRLYAPTHPENSEIAELVYPVPPPRVLCYTMGSGYLALHHLPWVGGVSQIPREPKGNIEKTTGR